MSDLVQEIKKELQSAMDYFPNEELKERFKCIIEELMTKDDDKFDKAEKHVQTILDELDELSEHDLSEDIAETVRNLGYAREMGTTKTRA